LKIQEFRAAVLALWWVGPAAAQTATSTQWQNKAEAAVAEIRGTVQIAGLKEAARDAMLLATLETARLKLSARQGPDIKEWAWGQLHRIKFQHPLDAAPGAAALFDRGPMQRSGDGEVVQATTYRDDSFDQLSGASYREIFDLADWDRSVGINVPGQSGQPQAKHYADLLPLWIEGKYFPLSFTKGAVDALTTDVLYLTPAPKLTAAHQLTAAHKVFP
jgi:penicillin amidase